MRRRWLLRNVLIEEFHQGTKEITMKMRNAVEWRRLRSEGGDARERLLSGTPAVERRLELAGVSTAVLEGGEGPPVVLLHGPGEFAAKWLRVIPDLVTTHRVIAPDLPGHGTSEVIEGPLDADRVLTWLSELIEHTCTSPPALVGHVLGGAIAARFAIDYSDRLDRLVLVDTLGLGRFRPTLRFALTMIGFLARPTEGTYDRFMRQCSYDLDSLREEMGERWDPERQGRLAPPDVLGRGARDSAGGAGAHLRTHNPDLGAVRPCKPVADRRGCERALRMAAARDRQLCRRPPA
jgi:pimeloyl-ACP methyl ester carboxylesterase